MAYSKAPAKEKIRKRGRLSRKGDKIKFVDIASTQHKAVTINI